MEVADDEVSVVAVEGGVWDAEVAFDRGDGGPSVAGGLNSRMKGVASRGHSGSRRVKWTRHPVLDMELDTIGGQLNSA
ncbi:hypothetical protein ACIREE_38815 [Streptomyces sp. NPDC102467]|uniref:hypothetical protein n=1 Tax=Streptomyces sp. NPDC102467 TaxID=3366179 RepID=UPI0037FB9C57